MLEAENVGFFFRLFRTYGKIHECDCAYKNTNLDSHVSPVKLTQTKINKENSWNCSNNKQKLQYSNKVKAKDEFPASETGENIFEVPAFSIASQPHDVQGNCLFSCFL